MDVRELVLKRDPRSLEQHRGITRNAREYSATGQKRDASLVGGGRRNVTKENQNVCSQSPHLIINFSRVDFSISISCYSPPLFAAAAQNLPHEAPFSSTFEPNS